ncbi:MAG: N-acetylmuramoyl-L-alanine amidase [Planctomycetota bacterium]
MRRLVVAPVFIALCAFAAPAQAQPAITWSPASSSNYRALSSRNIDSIIIHKVEGSLDSCVNWFKNPSARVSAHYVVNSSKIVQMVRDKDRAWHAGNTYYNAHAIGIENEGWSSRNDTTDAHYRRLASLVAYLCKKYGIPMNRQKILAHSQINGDKSDPGKYFNWTLFMSYVQQAAGGTTTTPPPVTPPPTTQPPTTQPPSGISGYGVATTAAVNVRASAWGTVLGVAPALSGWVRTGNVDQDFAEVFFRGRKAWISQSYLSGLSGTGVKVTADTLNVRAGPGMSDSIVGAIYNGQMYVTSESSNDGTWAFIRYDQLKRWVYKSYAPAFTLK